MGDDPEPHRARDTFAALAEAARHYGLRSAIEAIPYMQTKRLGDAVAPVGDSGGGIIIDPLHLPGDGEPALAAILATVPAGLPFSLETPSLALLEELAPAGFARRARQALARLLAVAEPAS